MEADDRQVTTVFTVNVPELPCMYQEVWSATSCPVNRDVNDKRAFSFGIGF